MNHFRHVGSYLRLAIVTDVNYDDGIMKTRWLDGAQTDDAQDVPIPHPASGKGEGIYFGIRKGSLVALAMAAYERYIPVAIIPTKGFYSNVDSLPGSQYDDMETPSIKEGEVAISGMTGAKIFLDEDGNISLVNAFGEGTLLGGDPDKEDRCTIINQSPAEYSISQTGLKADGIIRRDLRPNEEEFETSIIDPLTDVKFEHILEDVGLDPSKEVSLVTRAGEEGGSDVSDKFRNPPFVENRKIINEFGSDWGVGNEDFEKQLLSSKKNHIPKRISTDRRERRTNVLSLSYTYPNELIETVEGTLVDLFGNLLDGNRNILPKPSDEKEIKWLEEALENTRHTIAFHKEINSRKGVGYRGSGINVFKPNKKTPLETLNNARDRSRWFIDVDKEGITKINIPASSETGTVPLLSRYENSSTVEVDDKGHAKKTGREQDDVLALFRPSSEKDSEKRDIFLDQFGPGGIEVSDAPENRLRGEKTSWTDDGDSTSQQPLSDRLQAGTAFHDITKTAIKLLKTNLNQSSADAVGNNTIPVKDEAPAIHNKINRVYNKKEPIKFDENGRPINGPNAGGRSVNLNLDGSLEMSIGANTVDRVSWILDTAGGIVSRIGRDRFGRSAIIHMDGSLALEVGGFDFIGNSPSDKVDTRFSGGKKSRSKLLPKDKGVFRAGKVVIRVRRGDDSGPDSSGDQLIIIDKNGISIESTGRLNLTSTGDMTLKSDSRVLIDGRQVQIYENNARYIIKNGKPII